MNERPVSYAVLNLVVAAIASLPTVNAETLASYLGVLAESSELNADEVHHVQLLAHAVDAVHVRKLVGSSGRPSAESAS